MKKFLSLLFLLVAFTTVGLAQSQCVDVEEIDGSPKAPCIRELKVTNGTLSCPTVNRCTLTISGGGGSGTVTSVSVTTANGVSATCATCTTTPALTFVLGAITPTTVNGLTITSSASGVLTIAAGKTLTASNTLTFTGTDGSSVAFGTGGTVAYTTNLPVGANPTASVGLSTVNGVATTFLRSDGAPPLDQGIAPTWTGIHTWGSGLARMTSPRITTSILDANGLAIISLNPTASAVNSLQVTNGATGSQGVVDLAAIGSDSDVRLTLTPKGTAGVRVTSGVTTGSGTTAGFQVAVDSLTTGAGASFASSSVTSGNVVSMASTSTAAASNTQTVLNVATSGANGTSTQTTYGLQVSNTHTGTSSTNIGAAISATGGSANTALLLTGSLGQSGSGTFSLYGGNGTTLTIGTTNGGTSVGAFTTSGIFIPSGSSFGISSSSGSVSGWDIGLARLAANVFRVTNGSTGSGSIVLGTSTAGSIGTSGVGVLAIANGTAPTSSPADTAQLYTADINGTAGSAGFHIRNEINTAALILPGVRYKTDTGDPTDTYEGMMVINTFDNTFKVYAEGAWRTITTW